MSQQFSPWTRAWGETLGEDVEEARFPFPDWRSDVPRGGGGELGAGGPGAQLLSCCVHVLVHITESVSVN